MRRNALWLLHPTLATLMQEIIKQNSKLVGALFGVLQGLPQGLNMGSDEVFSKFSQDMLIVFVAFGLFAPPFFALLNSVSQGSFVARFMKKINEYVNLYSMMVIGCFTLGISGWATLQYKGINDGTFVICAFFISGGFGFLVAYFIDGQFGRKAEMKV
jgi:hypothetical protein